MWFRNSKRMEPWWLLGAILAAKATLTFIDHDPRFFLGDSVSYLTTAVNGWIPPDRSFLYGFVIRWFIMPFRNIEALVMVQAFVSALTVWIGVVIIRRAGLNNRMLLGMLGLVWVVAPIQLFYERFMMAECVSLFVFAMHLAVCIRFIRRPHWGWFGALAITAFLLVAMRVSYLPNILYSALALPLLVFIPGSSDPAGETSPRAQRLRATFIYLALSVVLTGVALVGYKQLYAFKSGNPPAYHSRQGYFMLSTVAPLLDPSDFADPGLRSAVYAEGGLDLKDRVYRDGHIWDGNGLLQRMERYLGDPIEADQLARKIATSAMVSHPVEFIGLGWTNAKAYLQPQVVSKMVRADLNRDRPLWGEFRQRLDTAFSYTGDGNSESLTATSYFKSIPWYMFLVVASLPLVLVAVAVSFSRARLALFVAGHLFVAFAVIIWLASTATVRYLHVIEFLFLFTFGLTVAELMAKRSLKGASSPQKGSG